MWGEVFYWLMQGLFWLVVIACLVVLADVFTRRDD
jgi:hypothetical protein